ncbi:hypothetical protein PPHE_a3769 [Pseudoalteromonas phenolica O-BC30]|nr:hypothetical protein [Pseudoalteromonas phenolica O-BC30]
MFQCRLTLFERSGALSRLPGLEEVRYSGSAVEESKLH